MYVVDGHAVQDDLPAPPENLPHGQSMHCVALGAEYFPAEQMAGVMEGEPQ